MEDILKRLGVIESTVADIRAQVSAITAVLPHLATKADLNALKGELKESIQSNRAEVQAVQTEVCAHGAISRRTIFSPFSVKT